MLAATVANATKRWNVCVQLSSSLKSCISLISTFSHLAGPALVSSLGFRAYMELPRWHLWQELTSDAIATVALKDSGGEKDFFYQAQLRVEVKNNTRTFSLNYCCLNISVLLFVEFKFHLKI